MTGPSFSRLTAMWAPKRPRGDGHSVGGHGLGVGLHQRRRRLGTGGAAPAGAVAAAQVGKERELADAEQGGAGHVHEGPVEGALVAGEDPHAGRLVGEPAGLGLGVARGDADEREQAGADGARPPRRPPRPAPTRRAAARSAPGDRSGRAGSILTRWTPPPPPP